MARTLEVVTPENVAIRYEIAGFGSRGVAAVVDAALQLLIIALLFLLLVVIGLVLVWFHVFADWSELQSSIRHFVDTAGSVLLGVAIVGYYLIIWGYHVLFETLWSGESPGKRFMGLRVIKDGGYPVDFRAVVIRNLLRGVDAQPGVVYGVALVVSLINPQYKRLGDMAAGTLVVRHGAEEAQVKIGFGEAVVYRLLDTTVITQLSRLTREEYRTLRRFLDRRNDLAPSLRGEFARRLALPLFEKFGYQPPAFGVDYERWLDELDLAYRTRTLGTAREAAATPAMTPEAHAPAAPVDTRKW